MTNKKKKPGRPLGSKTKNDEVPDSVFNRQQKLEISIRDALAMEAVRHEAAVAQMQKLKALRLQREAEEKKNEHKTP